MRVYLAARYSRRDELREYAKQLEKRGHHVTSRWLQETGPLNTKMGDDSDTFYAATAHIDLDDIRVADTLVFFAEDPLKGTPRGGRHVEYGFALALYKFINVIGPKENVFHYGNPMITHYNSFEEYMDKDVVEVTFD